MIPFKYRCGKCKTEQTVLIVTPPKEPENRDYLSKQEVTCPGCGHVETVKMPAPR